MEPRGLKLEYWDPSELQPNGKNWRRHPATQVEALGNVLDRVGWAGALLYNEASGRLIDGHARRELAIKRGTEAVPVLIGSWSEEEERLILATLDPIAAMAEASRDSLASLLGAIQASEPSLAVLLELIARDNRVVLPQGAGLTEPDEAPPLPDVPVSKPGDLWLLGEHRLLCGDATKLENIERLMGEEKAAILWTDPPYGVSYEGKTRDALTIANDGAEGLSALLCATFAAVSGALEPGAPFYIAHPAGPKALTFWNVIDGLGWQIHQCLVWVKDSMVLGHSDYHYRHEPILYGWMPGPGRSGRGRHEGSRWYGDHSQTTVFEIPRPQASREHPTMKPVELVERCLRNSSQLGQIVLDPFLGSGSTLIAAERLGRRCYGMEIDPRYVDVAVRRWEENTGRKAECVKTVSDSERRLTPAPTRAKMR